MVCYKNRPLKYVLLEEECVWYYLICMDHVQNYYGWMSDTACEVFKVIRHAKTVCCIDGCVFFAGWRTKGEFLLAVA